MRLSRLELIAFVNNMVMQVVMALSDGVITADEAIGLVQQVFEQFKSELPLGDAKIFIETDGDFHIIIPKHILDNMKIKV